MQEYPCDEPVHSSYTWMVFNGQKNNSGYTRVEGKNVWVGDQQSARFGNDDVVSHGGICIKYN